MNVMLLSNSLFNKYGNINKSCIDELQNLIDSSIIDTNNFINIENVEWNKKCYIYLNEIVGCVANCIIRLSKNDIPFCFENICKCVNEYLYKNIKHDDGYSKLSLFDIKEYLEIIIFEKNVVIFDKLSKSYKIDLYSLINNVCIAIRDERRLCVAFEMKYKEHYKWGID